MKQIIKNIIGFFLGYGACDCGNTMWRDGDNPGISYDRGHGKIICNKCYLRGKKYIDENNRKLGGVDIKDHNCKHKWEKQGAANFWCSKCDSVMALSCPHGGSIACDNCVEEWMIKQGIVEEWTTQTGSKSQDNITSC